MKKTSRLNTCFVCGYRLLANEMFPLDHWNGRKKEEIAREVMLTEQAQFKILNSKEMDVELASRPLAPSSRNFEAIAQQILFAEKPESGGQVARTRNDLAEVV